jgi:hypothetical protein
MDGKPVPTMLVVKTREWLGDDGIEFFREVNRTQGNLLSLSFSNGIQVIEFMKSTPECRDWTDVELDSAWANLIELCIK